MIKKIISAVLLCSIIFTRCDIERLPLNGPTAATFPASEEEAMMGLYAAYKGLTLLDASSTPLPHVMDNITDIGYARPGTNYSSPITSSLTTDNALIGKPWETHYKTIARCHLVLDHLENIKSEMTDDRYRQIEAELRFIRAYCYSLLVELYGDVPLVLKTLDLDNSDLPRTPKDKIQQWIIDEMDQIADNLPASQSAYGNVRAGRVAAYMLKARVALYSEKYKEASAAAHKALELSEGIFELTPFDKSIDYCNQTHEVGEPECTNIYGYDGYATSKEWIWIMEYNQLISGNTHNQGYYMGSRLGRGCCYWGPTQNLIDSFQDKDGNPIDKSTIYDAENPFKNRDPRMDMYCARPHSRLMGIQFEPNTSFKKVNNYWNVINGQSTTPSSISNTDATNAYRSFSGYLWRKHTDNKDYETNSSKGVSDLNVGIFRYAELLLLYAEAKIEANEIDASVYEAINKIRLRAKMPVLPNNLTQQELRTALRYERKIELCNDGVRWYDLRRWGIASEVMNGYIYLNRAAEPWTKDVLIGIDENYSPKYNHVIATKYFNTQEVVYKESKDKLWPVPQSEIDANKNLVQNPGY
ncbi:MAG: RagB/SusD family nutrient uptake outer membrane protein [Massilibacteroides sp.]|nr:RagB/SusD family nutrient uptake outer membrane protein [Massilibacteroides sp.]MDD3063427.1 RagB/SusD family nutrient uptake outer membrane protein [Massilibacteroides sp.]MDD4115065.1 RagB/SusD family nutrient uptake outer membrane protein [Massilibacteroides sp.]MDD4660468.1 RagB/SusD family nutrient uptake outer membrane protein [Massilibacteroides sp.]